MIARLLPLMSLVVALAAADPVVAPAPVPRLLVFRDGAELEWRLELPAGTHRLALPDRPRGQVNVAGAGWRVEDTDDVVTAPQPAALADLCAERNRWAAERRRLGDQTAAHAAAERRLRARLPLLADQAAPAVTAWQQSLDALLEDNAALAREDARLTARRAELADQATALIGDAGKAVELLVLDQPETVPVVTPSALAGAWTDQTRTTRHRRQVVLATAQPASVVVHLHLAQVRWDPAAVLTLVGDRFRLVRQARLSKPADLDLGVVPVTVATGVLAPVLAGPAERPVRADLRDLAAGEGRQVATGSGSGNWSKARSQEIVPEAPEASAVPASIVAAAGSVGDMESRVMAAVAPASVSASTSVPAAPVAPAPVISPTPAGLAETWDLGPVALAKGETQTVCDRPATTPTREADEWALIPSAGPVLIRRLGVKLDDQPLQPGPLTLVIDGVPAGSTVLEAQPPGAVLWLRAGEDAGVFAGDPRAWDLKDEPHTTRRQVTGTTLPVHNLGTTPRQVRIYRTWPISRSQEITVTLDPRTTPGQQVIEPGVLRWDLTIPAGGMAPVDLGWTVESSGNLKL